MTQIETAMPQMKPKVAHYRPSFSICGNRLLKICGICVEFLADANGG
jgi:hypothetical protein